MHVHEQARRGWSALDDGFWVSTLEDIASQFTPKLLPARLKQRAGCQAGLGHSFGLHRLDIPHIHLIDVPDDPLDQEMGQFVRVG